MVRNTSSSPSSLPPISEVPKCGSVIASSCFLLDFQAEPTLLPTVRHTVVKGRTGNPLPGILVAEMLTSELCRWTLKPQ